MFLLRVTSCVHFCANFQSICHNVTLAESHLYFPEFVWMSCTFVDRSVLVKMEEYTDDNFSSYFWPFTVVVSICFLGVVVFSVSISSIWILDQNVEVYGPSVHCFGAGFQLQYVGPGHAEVEC